MSDAKRKAFRALFLPPMPWNPARRSYVPGSGPDPLELDRQLETLGIETAIFDPHGRPWNPFAGRNTLLESFDPLRALRVLSRERNFDIVVSVFEGAALPLLALRRLMRFRTKIVLWDIGLTEQWKLRERTLNFVVPRVDGILVLGSNQKPYIEQRWHARTPVEVVGHRIDTTFFSPSPEPPSPDGPILSLGEDTGRDFETLLGAIEGLDADVVVKTRRQSGRVDPSRFPRARLISDWLAYTDLRQLYARSRFVVVPLVETPNANGVTSVLEAGAMGKAIVVTNTAAIQDFIVPGETCLTVPPKDPRALRDAIERLLAEPETRERLGANARRFIENGFSEAVFARRFAEALRRFAGTVGKPLQ